MATPIKNKVTLKLYGDKELQQQMVDILTSSGLVAKGWVDRGNPYTTQKEESGWATTITFLKDH